MPALPNLFVVGAMKAGTTGLHHVLARHPDVFMSRVKEPKHFAFPDAAERFHGPDDPDENRYWVDPTRYFGLFDRGAGFRYRGESSTIYLYRPTSAEAIHRVAPEARVVIVLRDPVDRAYSQFNFVRQRGLEPESSFARALACEDERVARGWGSTWHYRRMSCYAAQVERFLDRFGERRVFVGPFDELRAAPFSFYRRLFEFLELPPDVPLDFVAHRNRSQGVRSPAVAVAARKLRSAVPPRFRARLWTSRAWRLLLAALRPVYRLHLSPLRPLEPGLRERLRAGFAGDLAHLETLLGWRLDRWRASEST